MQNSNVLEKSKGVVVFAFNSSTVNYVKIADLTARLINKNLQLPITLITDNTAQPDFDYDSVIRIENDDDNFRTMYGNQIQWRNKGRYLAYELTPYDKTLLLDTDYLVLDSSLLSVMELDFDYKIMQESIDYQGKINRYMGELSHDWLWATVVFFTKTKKTKALFDLISRIESNYTYYRTLYNLNSAYRNDYAFALADMIINGYSTNSKNYLPFKMLTINDKISDMQASNKNIIIRHETAAYVTPFQNLHVIDKDYLQTDKFKKFIEYVTT